MSVRGHEDVAGGVEDDLAVLRHAGPHALGEEEDVVGIEAEVIVLLEALHGRGVVGLARHHVERDRRAVADRAREDLAGVEVEERSAGDRTDRVAALRAVVAEARTLSARDEERGDLAGLELLLTRGDGLGELLALEDGDLRGLALRAVRHVGAGLEGLLAVGEILGFDRGDLLEERGLLLLAQLLPVGEDVFLSALLEHLLGFSVVHLLCLSL